MHTCTPSPSIPHEADSIAGLTTHFRLGADFTAGCAPFTGFLDEVQLTQDQDNVAHTSFPADHALATLGLFRCNEGGGAQVLDTSPSQNHLHLSQGTLNWGPPALRGPRTLHC